MSCVGLRVRSQFGLLTGSRSPVLEGGALPHLGWGRDSNVTRDLIGLMVTGRCGDESIHHLLPPPAQSLGELGIAAEADSADQMVDRNS